MGRSDTSADELIDATERWFLKRGTPHLIEDYDAGEDILTRVLPVLILVFLIEIAGASSLHWTWWQNLLAVSAGAAMVAAIWAGVNRLRGRTHFQAPDDVGAWEIGIFLVVPPLLPLVFGGQVRVALATFILNLAILAAVYLVASYGLVPMTRWAMGRTLQELGAVAGLFGRSMPLLLLFSVALFINGDVWTVAASLDTAMLVVTCGFFVLLGLGFLFVRLPVEVRAIDDDLADEVEVEKACAGTPLAEAAPAVMRGRRLEHPPLRRRQRGNLLLVLLFSQAVQVLLVSVAMTLFFFVFGLIAIRPEAVAAWLPESEASGVLLGAEVHARWTWFERELVVSRALLQLSVLLGAMSGFYFTVHVITDSTYREEFFTEVVEDIRQSLGVRMVYLALRADRTASDRQ